MSRRERVLVAAEDGVGDAAAGASLKRAIAFDVLILRAVVAPYSVFWFCGVGVEVREGVSLPRQHQHTHRESASTTPHFEMRAQ